MAGLYMAQMGRYGRPQDISAIPDVAGVPGPFITI